MVTLSDHPTMNQDLDWSLYKGATVDKCLPDDSGVRSNVRPR